MDSFYMFFCGAVWNVKCVGISLESSLSEKMKVRETMLFLLLSSFCIQIMLPGGANFLVARWSDDADCVCVQPLGIGKSLWAFGRLFSFGEGVVLLSLSLAIKRQPGEARFLRSVSKWGGEPCICSVAVVWPLPTQIWPKLSWNLKQYSLQTS